MSTGKAILDRIKSVKNTGKITRAMELISTVKMKKAQEEVFSARPFAIEAMKIFGHIMESIKDSPLCGATESKLHKELLVVVTSNRGLCGAYNVNVFREIARLQKEESNTQYEFVTVGKKAREFVVRTGGTLVADFSEDFDDDLDLAGTRHISQTLKSLYLEGKYDRVNVMYSHYVSAISQKTLERQLYPMNAQKMEEFLQKIIGEDVDITPENVLYKIEPNEAEITENVVPMVLDVMFLEMLLEAKASEHAARMVAMKNARESSHKKVGELTLVYNKARQAGITKEISEIVSGVESMKDV